MPRFYNTVNLTQEELKTFFLELRRKYYSTDNIVLPEPYVNDVNSYNCEVTVYTSSTPSAYAESYANVDAFTYRTKHTPVAGVNTCLIQLPASVKAFNSAQSDTYYYYLLLTTAQNYAGISIPSNPKENGCRNNYSNGALTNYSISEGSLSNLGNHSPYAFDSDYMTKFSNHIIGTPEATAALNTIKLAGNYYAAWLPDVNMGGHWINKGIVELQGAAYYSMFIYTKFPYPVFSYKDTDAIINYLNTGDDSGKIDPFDVLNPEIPFIDDFHTDYNMFLSKGTTNTPTVSITSSNAQYYQNRAELQGLYYLYLKEVIGNVMGDDIVSPSAYQIPQVTLNNMSQGSYDMAFTFGNLESDEYSTIFRVTLDRDYKKQGGYAVRSVWYHLKGETENLWTQISSYDIVGETYVYTASSGDRLTISFTSITYEDLKDLVDDGYINRDSEENDSSGDDIIPVMGAGYNTFKIDVGAFSDINDAMWETDWSTLFKPSNTSPTQCVISCKRIPFTLGGTAVSNIPIANLNVAISGSAAKVNPIKSYNVGEVILPAIYGNFVDMYMAKVRCYLPFIGWVELPADAVISKVGRPSVGIKSETRVLKFKYIIDFVDGTCKCIISVNNTERWMFDGSCAVDVPITSDNHSAAVTRSAKSLASTGLSVAGAVVSAATGNELGALMGIAGAGISVLNSVPSYSYQVSGSISGLIESSCNHHIMIIIEYPNAWYPNGTEHKVGLPCELYMPLGSLKGFTKTRDIDVSGVNCTREEAEMIKSYCDTGIYL